MRSALWLGLGLASACQAAVATPDSPPVSGAQATVERLTAVLVDLAARRIDIDSMRGAVLPFHGDAPGAASTLSVANDAPRDDPVSLELQREFELALANRVHLVEPRRDVADASPASASPAEGVPGAAAQVLLGEYAVRDGQLVLSVRLVDLDSQLVLSAARDVLPLTWFSARARERLVRAAPPAPVLATYSTPAAGSYATPVVAAAPGSSPMPPASESMSTAALASAPTAAPAAGSLARVAPSPTPVAAAEKPPVEDFETWLARRKAERGEPSSPRSSVTSAAVPVSAPTFPWRQDSRLAELLRLPRSPR